MSYTILGTLFALVAGGLFVTPYWAPPDDTGLDLTNDAFVLVDRETIPDFGVQNEEFEVIKEEVLHFQDVSSEISEIEKSFTSEFRAPERPRWFQQNRLRRAENAPHDDPRYASPVEELVCLKNKQKNFFESTVKSIGCCPEGDPEGKPFGAGRACCCGKIFDEQNQFCCEETCEVMLAVPKQKKQCKKSKNKENERIIVTTPETTTASSKAITTTKGESVPATFTTFTTEDSAQECPKLWEKKPKAMQKECDQLGSGVETCSISCPEGTRVNGSESLLCIGGKWETPAPNCCASVGCADDFKLDLFLVVDASSSIGQENFKLVRRFIKSLSDYFVLAKDKVRIGIVSFNRKVVMTKTLDQIQSKEELDKVIEEMPYTGKGTNTGRALQAVLDQGLDKNGDRPGVLNQILVITDGKSKDDIKTPSSLLKKKAKVMAIGVGTKLRKDDLYDIASDENSVYFPETYAELGELKYVLSDIYCPPRCLV